MRLLNAVIQITAFVNQNNFKNVTAFFSKAGSAKAALNKAYPFFLFALVNIQLQSKLQFHDAIKIYSLTTQPFHKKHNHLHLNVVSK